MNIARRIDIFEDSIHLIDDERLAELRATHQSALQRDHWHAVRTALACLVCPEKVTVTIDDIITIGTAEELPANLHETLERLIKNLIPWRKGPIDLFGHRVDAEWLSGKKWQRIAPHLDDIVGKRVLDIGCNNGYYMLRIAEQSPDRVLGIDPFETCYYQFQLLQQFLRDPRLQFELIGIDDLDIFPEYFDLVFCMGVIYHHRAPHNALRTVHGCMKPGGQLILESIAIPGNEPIALSPPDRYQMMRNVYFVPTASCLAAWAERAGFRDIEIITTDTIGTDEQRKTKYMPFDSLAEFLDPNDATKTIEGFPAPLRVALRARR